MKKYLLLLTFMSGYSGTLFTMKRDLEEKDNQQPNNTKRTKLPVHTFTFIEAARQGDAKKVKQLIKQGVNINGQGTYGETALMVAATHGHKKIVKILIQAGADLTSYDKIISYNALLWAASTNQKEIILMLIDAGATLEPLWKHPNKTALAQVIIKALLTAIKRNDRQLVAKFIKIYATTLGTDQNDNIAVSAKEQALILALSKGYKDIFNLCLDASGSYDPKTVFEIAIFQGHKDIAELLLAEYGPYSLFKNRNENIDEEDAEKDNPTGEFLLSVFKGHIDQIKKTLEAQLETIKPALKDALFIAAIYGHSDILSLLISSSSLYIIPDLEMAFRNAAYANQSTVVDTLLKYGVVNSTNYDGRSALHWAAKKGHTQIVEKLIAAGAQVNVRDRKKLSTPLMYAINKGYLAIVSRLLKAGADTSLVDSTGKTALEKAMATGNTFLTRLIAHTRVFGALAKMPTEQIKALLNQKASVSDLVKQIDSLLHYACSYGSLSLAQSALEPQHAFKRLNVQLPDGQTILMMAIVFGYPEIAKFVAKHMSKEAINAQDYLGNTALSYAVETGDLDLVNALIMAGARESITAQVIKNVANKGYLKIMGRLLFLVSDYSEGKPHIFA